MPFTYSITVGIGAGFVAYVAIKVLRGKAGQIHGLMWVVAAMFVVYFAINPITALFTCRRVGANRHQESAESSYDDSALQVCLDGNG